MSFARSSKKAPNGVLPMEENLPRVLLDGVVSTVDADGLLRFPSLGRTTRMEIESADLLLLNKVDLVQESDLQRLEPKLRAINATAPVIRAERCRVDTDLLFGLARQRPVEAPRQPHHLEFDSFSYASAEGLDRNKFKEFTASLAPDVFRAKGVRLSPGYPLVQLRRRVLGPGAVRSERHGVGVYREAAGCEKRESLDRLRACETSAARKLL